LLAEAVSGGLQRAAWVMAQGGAIVPEYLFRDLFTTDRAAGAVNGTAAEPGTGTRNVTDTGNQLSISGGVLRVVGIAPANADPRLLSSKTITRAAGRRVSQLIKVAAGKQHPYSGLTQPSTSMEHNFRRNAAEAGGAFVMTGGATTGSCIHIYDGQWYQIIYVLRPAGAAYYLNDGSWPRLWFVNEAGANNLVQALRAGGGGEDQDFSMGAWIEYDVLKKLQAAASDSFNRADGALGSTDGAGHQEADSGGSLAWTVRKGVAAVATNRAAFSGLDGGVGIATVDTGSPDGYIRAALYRSAGNVGVVGRWVDENNYYMAFHDGTNIKLQVVNAGVVSTLITGVTAYVEGRTIGMRFDGNKAALIYHESVWGQAGGINLTQNIAGTSHGIMTTDIGNGLDNFSIFPIEINQPARLELLENKRVFCVGDSITGGLTNYQATLRKALGDGWITIDRGFSGGRADGVITSRFTDLVTNKQPDYVVLLAGINDIGGSATAAAVKATLQALYTASRDAGAKVAACTILPAGASAGWTAGKQAILDEVNAWILDAVSGATDVDYRVDTYTAMEDGVTPDNLNALYDSGDGVHPNAAGYVVLGNTIHTGTIWA
jgi:acyl-CoA thioesterase I